MSEPVGEESGMGDWLRAVPRPAVVGALIFVLGRTVFEPVTVQPERPWAKFPFAIWAEATLPKRA